MTRGSSNSRETEIYLVIGKIYFVSIIGDILDNFPPRSHFSFYLSIVFTFEKGGTGRFAGVDDIDKATKLSKVAEKEGRRGGGGEGGFETCTDDRESSFIHGIFKKRFRANKSVGDLSHVVTRSRIKLMAKFEKR